MDQEDHAGKRNDGDHHQTDLMLSAKVLAGAAQSAASSHNFESIDKQSVAGAAGDLLGAARQYGKLEGDAGVGKYVQQAQTYLKSYSTGSDSKESAPLDQQHHDDHQEKKPEVAHASHDECVGGEEEEAEAKGPGMGDMFKMAQGFLK